MNKKELCKQIIGKTANNIIHNELLLIDKNKMVHVKLTDSFNEL